MSQKFKSDIETQAGLIDSFGFTGTAGQVLSSTGTKTEWITPPQSPGGGGSSQVFYFNGGTASSVGGYYQMSPVANTGTGADFTINANGYIASFLTDVASPNQLNIPAGNWNFEIYFSASSSGGSPSFYVELYKYSSGGVFTLIASSSVTPEGITNGTAIDAYFTPLAVPATTLLATDRLAVRVYVTHSGRTIKMHTQNGHLSEVITTFSTGLTALNGLTEQVQYFSTGTTGTDFNIASAVNTHTFNLPTASATNRGALSSADWITFNSKANASGTTNYVSKFTGATTLGDSQIFDNGTNVGIGTASPSYKLDVSSVSRFTGGFYLNEASAGTNAAIYLASDQTLELEAFGTSGAVAFSTGSSVSERMRITSAGNVGIGTTSPTNYTGYRTLSINSTSGGVLELKVNDVSGLNIFSDISQSYLYESRNLPLAFYTNTLERMRIASNGAIKFNSYGSGSFTGTATQRLAVDSSGNVIEIPIGGGAVDGSGTTNYVTKWTDADTIGNSQIFDNGTNVGLGTTTPGAKLDVSSGNINLSNSFNLTARNNANTFNIALIGRSSTDRVIIDADGYGTNIGGGGTVLINSSGGNVGIGTTNPTFAKLKVSGASASGAIISEDTSGTTSFVRILGDISSQNLINWQSGTALRFATSTQDYASFSEAMRITSSGNVGIGTTSPSGKLHIKGGNNDSLYVDNDGSQYTPIYISNNGSVKGFTVWDNTNSIFQFGSAGANPTAFYTNSAERMRITTGGNVGIGTTSPTTGKVVIAQTGGTQLHLISGEAYGSADVVLRLTSDNDYRGRGLWMDNSATAGVWYAGVPYTGGSYSIGYHGTQPEYLANSKFFIDTTGKVGIGTTSPISKLNVNTTDSANNVITVTNGTQELALGVNNGSGGSFLFENSNSALRFGTAGSERMRITNSGNLLLGQTSDFGYLLQVNGTSYFQGAALFNSSVTASQFKTPGFVEPASVKGLFNNTNYSGPGWNNASLVTGNGATGVMMGGDAASYTYGWIQGVQTDNGANKNLILEPLGGNVGIGTTSPSAKLEVRGSTAQFQISQDATHQMYFGVDSSYAEIQAIRSGIGFDKPLILQRQGGNVGIGTTSPKQKLIVEGVLATKPPNVDGYYSYLRSNWNENDAFELGISEDGASNFHKLITSSNYYYGSTLQFWTADVERMRINSSGNVGIGTTSPASLLDVSGASPVLTITRTSGSFTNTINFNSSASNFASIISNSGTGEQRYSIGPASGWGGFHTFYTDTTEKMRITSSGNVGIGTVSPHASALLHLRSTTQGFLPPVMRTGERNGISSPAIGLMIFNEEEDAVQVYTGGGWKTLAWL